MIDETDEAGLSRPGAGVRMARSGRPVVLVCGKCLKRQRDGKAFRRALKDEGRGRLGVPAPDGRRPKPPRIVRAGCLGLCPKRAVVLASGETLARGRMVLAAGPDDVPAALDALLPGRVPDPSTPIDRQP